MLKKQIHIAMWLSLAMTLTALDGMAEEGDTLWTRTYGNENHTAASSVIQTSDRGYLLAGCTYPAGYLWKYAYLVKTDEWGDTLWVRTYGENSANIAYSVIQTRDGCYLFAGVTSPSAFGSCDMYLVKLDSSGDTLWTRIYGDSSSDGAKSLIQTSDGYYLITGYTRYGGPGWIDSDIRLVKTDTEGDTLWSRIYSGSNDSEASSVLENFDGDYLMAGWIGDLYYLQRNMYLVKTDPNGDTLWTRTYWGYSWANSVIQTSDAGYLLAGAIEQGGGNISMYMLKTDPNGEFLWAQTYGISMHDWAYSVIQTPDDGYLLAGVTGDFEMGEVNLYVVKTDSVGEMLWMLTYEDSTESILISVIQNSDGNYVAAGTFWAGGNAMGNMYLVCMEGLEIVPVVPQNIISMFDTIIFLPFPNPFNASTTLTFSLPVRSRVTIEVFDVAGRYVGAGFKPAPTPGSWYPSGIHHILFDGSGLASGVYLARLEARAYSQTQKLVLLK